LEFSRHGWVLRGPQAALPIQLGLQHMLHVAPTANYGLAW
jgi:hypothetical protein